MLVHTYIAWLGAELQDDHTPTLVAELNDWMNKASKWSGGAGYAGLGEQDAGEIPTSIAAVLAENEEVLGLVGSRGVKIVIYEGKRFMMVTGNFMQLCLAMGIL